MNPEDLPLRPKQKVFVEAYDGNATKAAKVAGYRCPAEMGYENLNKPHIKKAIEEREKDAQKKRIMTREERQIFWSDVVRGNVKEKILIPKIGKEIKFEPDLKTKLKASELLGRSQVDFTEKRINEKADKVTVTISHTIVTRKKI